MNKKLIGSLFLTLSALIYGSFGLISRFIGSFEPFTQSWIKSTFILIILVSIMVVGKIRFKKIERKDVKWFALWILPASFQPVLSFLAFNHLPVGMTYFFSYSTMVLGGIISGKIFFSEKMDSSKIVSIFLLLFGMLLIYGTDLNLVKNIYVIFILLAGMILGFWNTLTKKVSGNYSEYQMLIMDGSTALVLCLFASIIFGEKTMSVGNITPWIWIFVYALLAVLASVFLIKGFRNVEAQAGSLILPMEIVFGTLFGYLFLGEIMNTKVYIGGLLILIAAILPVIKKKLRF